MVLIVSKKEADMLKKLKLWDDTRYAVSKPIRIKVQNDAIKEDK